ncbi:MAG: MMPL family transporter [Clostridia bacterium]|nr:MMPL family transporter [Clostridia bacterium]
MSKEKRTDELSVIEKAAATIVDRRNLFFLLFLFAVIFSVFSQGWVQVENDITVYLPESTETRVGLELMDREFVTYGTADFMVSNISYQRACWLADEIKKIDGVNEVAFENNEEHFKGTDALFSVTFQGEAEDDISVEAFHQIEKLLSGYDVYVSSQVGSSQNDSLANDMTIILLIAVVIIVLVLLITSRSYAEVPVLLITFGVAALLNKGTNFMLGKISFVSDSVAVVLQLALAIDYAIILCHRYTEEREHLPQRDAVVAALSKAIPEIFSSCLTTVSGLAALITMQFRIGQDLAFVLIKAIFLSILSVFVLMPGLLMIFGNSMKRTAHKNFIPKIPWVGKWAVKTKKFVPPIFLALMVTGFFLSSSCPYCYGQTNLPTIKKSQEQIAQEKINNTFSHTNTIALVVPSGDYQREAALLAELNQYDEVASTLGLSNTEAMNGYMLTDSLRPREFSELTEVEYEAAKLLYAAYAAEQNDYGRIINNLDSYSVPIIDMLMFLHTEMDRGYITLDDGMTEEINTIYSKIADAKRQLQSDSYSRMLVELNLEEEGEETFAFLDQMHQIMAKYYPENAYLVGNSTSDYDLSSSFSRDNVIISVLSALFVVIVLLFTFKSAGLPVLLIALIQGSIWINFSFPYLMKRDLFFLGYLIVSSIQMGANIDYAIVISSRFSELKETMHPNNAMVETLNQAFPTIITSGVILAAAGTLIGCISTNGVVASIGECLGRGTVISIFLVMGVLPQILLLGNRLIERTSFTIKKPNLIHNETGTMYLNGRVRGSVSGMIDADVHGVVRGQVNAMVKSDAIEKEDEEDENHEA